MRCQRMRNLSFSASCDGTSRRSLMARNRGLATRENHLPAAAASLQLGGITLYAATNSALNDAMQAISQAIRQASEAHLTLTRVTLASEVKKLVGVTIEKRVFGAILGLQLRLGVLDCIPCAAISGKVFRIYAHQNRIDEFTSNLRVAEEQLRHRGVLEVRQLETRVFGSRKWGTWSSAMHLLARLVQKGRARYQDS